MAEKNYGNDSQLAELVKYISDTMKFPIMGAGGGFAPIGTINSYMGTTAPQGWLVCDGQTYNISDYLDLATHIASHFGSANFFGGDGTTTFGVPDLRGEFLRGSGTNSHANQGSGVNVGVHQDGTIHFSSGATSIVYCGSYSDSKSNMDFRYALGYDGSKRNIASKSNEDTSIIPYTSRPTNTSVLFIIKATLSDTELDNMHVYSPNEHQVGWWQEEVDGVLKQKPVYEKMFDYGQLPNNDEIKRNHNIANVDFIWIKEGFAINLNDSSGRSINFTFTNNSFAGQWMTRPDKEGVSVWTGNDRSSFYMKVVLNYTKTTDQWETV